MTDVVRAAGGVVWQGDGKARVVAVVHRPRYDDWSLPKGKAETDETDEDCARREVAEETGLKCQLGEYLGEVSYTDRKGRDKVVRYWAMEATRGEFQAGDEVDDLRWVTPGDAMALLTYDRDREVLERLSGALPHARRT